MLWQLQKPSLIPVHAVGDTIHGYIARLWHGICFPCRVLCPIDIKFLIVSHHMPDICMREGRTLRRFPVEVLLLVCFSATFHSMSIFNIDVKMVAYSVN